MPKKPYLDAMYELWQREERAAARSRGQYLSRRQVVARGSTILAMGGVAAFLEACSGGSNNTSSKSTTGGAANGGAASAAGGNSSGKSTPKPDTALNATPAPTGQSSLS